MYSGQSEEGYELFQIGDGIARVSGLPYVFGDGAGFCFSADESILVMALAFSSMEWWLPWEEEAAEPDDDGRLVFAFGELRTHDIATSAISVHEMRVCVGTDWEPARREYDPNLEPRFIDQRRLALSMPWGDIELDVPPRGQITLVVE
jgi:hypothetical protein